VLGRSKPGFCAGDVLFALWERRTDGCHLPAPTVKSERRAKVRKASGKPRHCRVSWKPAEFPDFKKKKKRGRFQTRGTRATKHKAISRPPPMKPANSLPRGSSRPSPKRFERKTLGKLAVSRPTNCDYESEEEGRVLVSSNNMPIVISRDTLMGNSCSLTPELSSVRLALRGAADAERESKISWLAAEASPAKW